MHMCNHYFITVSCLSPVAAIRRTSSGTLKASKKRVTWMDEDPIDSKFQRCPPFQIGNPYKPALRESLKKNHRESHFAKVYSEFDSFGVVTYIFFTVNSIRLMNFFVSLYSSGMIFNKLRRQNLEFLLVPSLFTDTIAILSQLHISHPRVVPTHAVMWQAQRAQPSDSLRNVVPGPPEKFCWPPKKILQKNGYQNDLSR